MKYLKLKSGLIIETDSPEIWPEGQKLTQAEGKRLLREQAISELKKLIKPGDTVHTILRHVSRSGMSRNIDLVISVDGDVRCISGIAALAINHKRAKDGSIVAGGCGMDMGFSLVYNLGYALWPHGTDEPHGTRNGEADYSGGYALKQRWI